MRFILSHDFGNISRETRPSVNVVREQIVQLLVRETSAIHVKENNTFKSGECVILT